MYSKMGAKFINFVCLQIEIVINFYTNIGSKFGLTLIIMTATKIVFHKDPIFVLSGRIFWLVGYVLCSCALI